MWKICDTLDWKTLHQTFSWLQKLDNVPQDNILHAEGTVAEHTRRVLKALLASEVYQEINPQEQAILVAATLLHDIGKSKTTMLESDGSITANNHEDHSAMMAQSILDQDTSCPPQIKSSIVNLVRYHHLPLSFFKNSNPEKAVSEVRTVVNTHLLGILAEANVLGRISPNQLELLHRVNWFKSFCKELQFVETTLTNWAKQEVIMNN